MLKLPTRVQVLQFAIAGGLVCLMFGLFQTQVIRGGYYRRVSEQNRIRIIRLEAPRGDIFDRAGRLLATSRSAYNVYAIPEDFNPLDLPALGRLLSLGEGEIRKRLSQSRFASFTPVLLKEDVSKETAMKVEEQSPELTGIFIQDAAIRTYPEGESAAHLVGYIGKISPHEYRQFDSGRYSFASWIGRSGIERAFDQTLRGEDGGRQLEVDARGIPIRLMSELEPEPGGDLHLTIDIELEKRLADLAAGKKSAILVMDLKKGELLAAVSTPGFDPNVFVTPGQGTERLSLIGAKDYPLFDRSLNGLYPPGSIFKLVTAMAALENGTITPHTTFQCPGYFRFGPRSRPFKCWFHEGHGRIDLYTALERSCNVYFYNVGRLLGEKKLAAYARKLGFGSSVAFELPTANGLVPDAEWKKKTHDEQWWAGETITLAIGQSYLLVSPLQILRLVSAIATDGRVFGPTLVQGDSAPEASRLKIPVREGTFKTIRQGMLQAVSSDRGTAQLARVNFAKLAGKTGTAQAPPGDPHAWFGGFFPFNDPEIAFLVFIERGKSGGLTAAQIAKKAVHLYHELYASPVS